MTKRFLLPQLKGASRRVFGAAALLFTLGARGYAADPCLVGTWTISPLTMHFAAWLGATQDVSNHPITVTPPSAACNWSAGFLAGTETYWFSMQPYPGGSVVNIYDIASNGYLSSRSGTVQVIYIDPSSVQHVIASVVISQDAATPASLSILMPKGGESFAVGSTQTLAWSYTPSDYKNLILNSGAGLVRSDGLTFNLLVNVYFSTATSVQWTVPTVAPPGTYTIQVGYQQSLAQSLVASSAPFEITAFAVTLACPNNSGAEGFLYSSALTATDGLAPYTFAITKGTLPVGLSLSAAAGAITGKPTAAGISSFTAQAVDSSGSVGTVACTIEVDQCDYSIDGPADVPGLSQYIYQLQPSTATGITWTADKPTASLTEFGPVNLQILAAFQNTGADWINIKASFTLGGQKACALKQIALVKVDVGPATFSHPNTTTVSENENRVFLDKPPAVACLPADCWVTTFTPGSAWQQFKSKMDAQNAEPRKYVASGGQTEAQAAFKASSSVTLTSPAEKSNAQQRIQVGLIQSATETGSASYDGGLIRTIVTPTNVTVDWLSPGGKTRNDEWPWYNSNTARQTGAGSDSWTSNPPLSMWDSPGLSIPAKYNPNDAADPHKNNGDPHATVTNSFVIQVGARTLDADLSADSHYFNEANSTWKVNFVWPLAAPNATIVTPGAPWTTPGTPTEINVNVVPAVIDYNPKYRRWNPATCPPDVCP